MATDKTIEKKKSAADEVNEAWNANADEISQASREAVDALKAAGEQQIADIQTAGQARTDAYNEAQRLYRQRMDEGYTNFADIVAGERKRAEDAEREAIAQREAERKAARWTGATELAASLANMISVGSFNASNQQYKQYSQDWMRQAEANWKANRARYDNLRDRQRALQQQIAQMRMADAGQTLSMAGKLADMDYQQRAALAQQRYQNSANVTNLATQGREKAATARTQGATQAANLGMQQKHLDMQAANLNETKRYHDALIADKNAKGAKGSGGSGGSNLVLSIPPTTEGGKGMRLTINSGSLISTINANVDLFKAEDQRAITRILRGTGSQDDKAKQLEQYIKSSPEVLELLKQSSSSVGEFGWGVKEEPTAPPSATSGQEQNGGTGETDEGPMDYASMMKMLRKQKAQ